MFDIIDKTFGNIVLKLESLPILEYKNLYTVPLYSSFHLLDIFVLRPKIKKKVLFCDNQRTVVRPNL